MLVKAFLFLWSIIAGVGIAAYLARSTVGVWVLGLASGIGAAAMYIALKERNRRNKEGYYVYKRGGAEDGILFYNEQGRELQFYFDRGADTIYIPTDAEWKENMPTWAHEHKQEIVSRIKRRVGKRLVGESWKYEETANPKQIVGQQQRQNPHRV